MLSVVVPSVNGWTDLRGCLDALFAEAERTPLEILVPERCGESVRRPLRETFPGARLLPVSADTTIPAMRAAAFRAATGTAVAVIEDHVMVPDGWAPRLLAEIAQGAVAVGGSIENAATSTLLDRAAFLCEYSHCLRPLKEGPATWLTGNNVAYRRDVLSKYQDVADEGRWENHLHDRMRADGIELICRPDICVAHKKHYTFAEYFSQRYLYSRSYAGARAAQLPIGARLICALASAALPPVLLWRIVTRVYAKTGDAGVLFQSSPLLVAFVLAWAWGDVVGSAAGPGDSLQRVC